MYAPKYAREESPEELKRFVGENGFAILFSNVDGKPWATHIPLVLNKDGTKLTGHVSRANRQWKDFENGTGLILNEKLNLQIGVAILVTVAGIYLVNRGYQLKTQPLRPLEGIRTLIRNVKAISLF